MYIMIMVFVSNITFLGITLISSIGTCIIMINEYQKTLLDELDLLREGANTIQLRRNFENSDSLK